MMTFDNSGCFILQNTANCDCSLLLDTNTNAKMKKKCKNERMAAPGLRKNQQGR